MNELDPVHLSVTEAARLIAMERLSATALTEALLARIEHREPDVRAWAFLDPESVRAAARACDATPPRGPLHGVPIGIKDVIATSDQPTQYNSQIYTGHRPIDDAVCVQRLRRAGAIIMGKTVTTEFAFSRPGATRNPHDLAHTPGGSSSGSAAAVADFMVPAALGTQTGGSMIRPSAFCGVYGYKPGFGQYPTRGLRHLAPSLDTIGLMTRNVADIALLSPVLADREPVSVDDGALPRLVLFHPPHAERAEPGALALLDDLARRTSRVPIRRVATPDFMLELDPAHRVIMAAETARSFATEWRDRRADLSSELADLIGRGVTVTEDELAASWSAVERARRWLCEEVASGEIVMTLSAAGEAPRGLESTGDAVFNRLWTILHAGCLHVPVGRGPVHGLPLGVQLVEIRGNEARLLAAANWLAREWNINDTAS
jgi:Asp-tRNA(Asn)/Glu-tRNA(Gln) amidotransferase A subunit family amidase